MREEAEALFRTLRAGKMSTALGLDEREQDYSHELYNWRTPREYHPSLNAPAVQSDEYVAGTDWESHDIPYVDREGRHADFHALRHTTGSWLAANNVHPKVAQSIMRHSDINLTMTRYSHVMERQEAEAVARLPDLSLPSREHQEEGGDIDIGDKDGLVDDLPTKGGKQRTSMNSSEQTTSLDKVKKGVSDKPSRVEKCHDGILSLPVRVRPYIGMLLALMKIRYQQPVKKQLTGQDKGSVRPKATQQNFEWDAVRCSSPLTRIGMAFVRCLLTWEKPEAAHLKAKLCADLYRRHFDVEWIPRCSQSSLKAYAAFQRLQNVRPIRI